MPQCKENRVEYNKKSRRDTFYHLYTTYIFNQSEKKKKENKKEEWKQVKKRASLSENKKCRLGCVSNVLIGNRYIQVSVHLVISTYKCKYHCQSIPRHFDRYFDFPFWLIIRHVLMYRPATLQLFGTVISCPISVKIHM